MSQPNSRRFQLHRSEDASGVSGTGVVAEGIEFTSGKVAMTWLTEHGCVNVYDTIKTVRELHGHEGRTVVVWLDEGDMDANDLATNPTKKRKKKENA